MLTVLWGTGHTYTHLAERNWYTIFGSFFGRIYVYLKGLYHIIKKFHLKQVYIPP